MIDKEILRNIIKRVEKLEHTIIGSHIYGEDAVILFSDTHVYKVFLYQSVKRIKNEIAILQTCIENRNICNLEVFNNSLLILSVCNHNAIKMKKYHAEPYIIDEKWLNKISKVIYQMHHDFRLLCTPQNIAEKYGNNLQCIHGDLRIENIVNTITEPIIIDFSDVRIGKIEYDIARLVQSLIYTHNTDNKLVVFFLQQYCQHAELLDNEKLKKYIKMHGKRRYEKDKNMNLNTDVSYKRLLSFVESI